MKRRIAALMGGWLTLSVVYMTAFSLFGHLFASEAGAGTPLVPFIVGFAFSNALLVLFYSWVATQMGHAIKAALAVAVPQLLLVNVSYVLSGSRTVIAGVVSSIVLLVAWPLVGVVYQSILGRPGAATAGARAPSA